MTVQKRLATYIPEISADSGLLYQVFLNILFNAIQAMPQGGTVFVELAMRNNILTIQFRDEGGGFPKRI